MENFKLKYFLAANSSEGFVSFFSDCYEPQNGWKAYIIKGGPGTGKSSFMKKIAQKFYEENEKVIICPCSSDPNSLDGVILPNKKIVLLDGTSPHVVEPKFAGVCEEILNFGEFWNSEILSKNKAEILCLSKENKLLHQSASNRIKAAGQLLNDNFMKISELTDKQKALRYAQNICKKYIPAKKGRGKEWVRFICGITPDGLISFEDTLLNETENHIIIDDNFGVASGIVTEYIKNFALKNGYEIIGIKNPFLPSKLYDHIIIPELSLGILRECDYHRWNLPKRRIHAERFYDTGKLRSCRYRLKFNRKAANELLGSAATVLNDAKNIHDKLEKCYIDAMDFEKLRLFSEIFLKKI